MIEVSKRRLLVDGRPRIVLAGELHYFRVPRAEWEQRLELAVEIGCDTIASYIPWLFHELPDGAIDVAGASAPERDVGAFIDLCGAHGLSFLARPGPFVMAELKNEGLPFRLYAEHPEIMPSGCVPRHTPGTCCRWGSNSGRRGWLGRMRNCWPSRAARCASDRLPGTFSRWSGMAAAPPFPWFVGPSPTKAEVAATVALLVARDACPGRGNRRWFSATGH
jgi:hypothetical protein